MLSVVSVPVFVSGMFKLDRRIKPHVYIENKELLFFQTMTDCNQIVSYKKHILACKSVNFDLKQLPIPSSYLLFTKIIQMDVVIDCYYTF